MTRPRWNRIILHHSASDWGTARVIDGWHRERGWSGIGYHFVLLNGYTNHEDLREGRKFYALVGSIETGRLLDNDLWVDVNEIGAHALGYNRDSIGICLIHRNGPYQPAMLQAVANLVAELAERHRIPSENVVGHCEVDSGKPHCPGFDVDMIRQCLGKKSAAEPAGRGQQ